MERRIYTSIKRFVITALALTTLVACKDEDHSIFFAEQSLTMKIGDTHQLRLEQSNYEAVENQDYLFLASNIGIISVSDEGLVSAINYGSSIVYVVSKTNAKYHAEIQIDVVNDLGRPEVVFNDYYKDYLFIGETSTLVDYKAYFADDFFLQVSDEALAVIENEQITALAIGSITVQLLWKGVELIESRTFFIQNAEFEVRSENSEGYSLVDNTLKISSYGVYYLSGWFNGDIIVLPNITNDVVIVLDSVTVNSDGHCINYWGQEGKVSIYVAPNTSNSLISKNGSAIRSENNVEVFNHGLLEIDSKSSAIDCSNLSIIGYGEMIIETEENGFETKQSLIRGGFYRFNCKNYGIHASKNSSDNKGTITITKAVEMVVLAAEALFYAETEIVIGDNDAISFPVLVLYPEVELAFSSNYSTDEYTKIIYL